MKLSDINALWDVPWCIGGDFNAIRFSQERRGGSKITRTMRGFNNFVKECALVDIPLQNTCFTWSNFQVNPSCTRFDRFLYSQEWEELFGIPSQSSLPRVTSDHSPILLHRNPPRMGPSPFRFENMWLSHLSLKDEIVKWWRSTQTSGWQGFSFITSY